jgi:death on curing protein
VIEFIDDCILFNETIDSGIVKLDLLNSAFSSYHYYSDITEQISSVVNGLIKNHPFKDGNKRTAVFFLYLQAELHNLRIINDSHIDDVIVKIAENKFSVKKISKMLFK